MRILTFIFIFMYFSGIKAQELQEVEYFMSLGKQNAFVMDYPGADKKMVENVFDDTVGEYGKVKRNRKADEWNCMACKANLISSDEMNIYYKIEEGKDLITSYLFFDDGQKFISFENDLEAAAVIEEICVEMYLEVKREIIRSELEELE